MNTNITPDNPPYPTYRATEEGSFAWDSTVRRWPIIIDSGITDMRQAVEKESNSGRKEEGDIIIKGLEDLKTEIASDKQLRLLKDNDKDVNTWNEHIKQYFPESTWFNGSWLFNECYMYRRIQELYSLTQHWKEYDIFNNQKIATFRGSYSSVYDLAVKIPSMIQPMSIENQELIFNEIIQVCLWGNATDLSLLTNMTEEDIKRLQATEKEKLAEQLKFVLVNNIDQVWNKLKDLQNGRIDFVLDNSGFEVFVDLVFTDWLIQTKRASKVVFNCKTIPWFVSDVMPKDVPILFDCCLDRSFFPGNHTEEQVNALETMVKRWQHYVQDGQLVIQSDSFWCNGLAYRYLPTEAPELFKDLSQSDLVIFKGDLNFRKLVFDCKWPVTTPFKVALGPDMAERFTNVLSLRTNKAETIVGLPEGKDKELEDNGVPTSVWKCAGKYAVVAYNQI
ncbi:unnamed protein product [Cunninghamella blakesleeana]